MLGRGSISAKRKWVAVGLSSIVMAMSAWLIVFAFVVAASDETAVTPGPPFALGLALVPFAFAALSFASGHPAAGPAVVVALLLGVAIAIPVSALAQDVVTGVAAGYGAGAVAALRRERHHSRRARIIAVVLLTTYVFVLLRTVPSAGLLAGSLLPFAAVATADQTIEWRAAERLRRGSGD